MWLTTVAADIIITACRLKQPSLFNSDTAENLMSKIITALKDSCMSLR